MLRTLLRACLLAALLPACSPGRGGLDAPAEAYVRLALAMEWRDPGHVDAYFGPPRWAEEAAERDLPLDSIRVRADSLLRGLDALSPAAAGERTRLRLLRLRLRALLARADLLDGVRLGFDEESRLLFGATAPPVDEASLRPVLREIDAALPGEGTPVERYRALKAALTIPRDRLDAVLRAALEGCRAATLPHLPLPREETVEVEYVTRRPWIAYHRYRGGYRSTVQVNTDFRLTLDDVMDVACHEAYPGHHVQAVLRERDLVRGRGWVEHSLIPLYAPESFVAEGAAQLAVSVAFPGDERARFEREVLLPLAGIDPAAVEPYLRLRPLVRRLAPAVDEGARRYLEGRMDRPTAAAWLEEHALLPGAEATLGFANRYRSYLITYNAGEAAVRRYLEARGGTPDRPRRRWELFRELLSTPVLPDELGSAAGATAYSWRSASIGSSREAR